MDFGIEGEWILSIALKRAAAALATAAIAWETAHAAFLGPLGITPANASALTAALIAGAHVALHYLGTKYPNSLFKHWT